MNFDILDFINRLHWLPIITLLILFFVVGALWHSPILFGKIWNDDNNFNNSNKKLNMPLVFGGTAIMHLIIILGFSLILPDDCKLSVLTGFVIGLVISIVFVFPVMAGTYLFANRSLKLLFIDAGMYIILYSIAGVIIVLWR